MADKKPEKAPKRDGSTAKEKEEKRLLAKHPFETMSQIQNRYGNGRTRNGSEGSERGADRLNH